MGWATQHIAKLQEGETVQFRPRGNSMSPKIKSGQLCTVSPVDAEPLATGDIVLCKVNGNQYLHLIKAISGKRFQIGNNRGGINGWVSSNSIYGRLDKVEA
ncbi:MAG: S24/S26 family peptidase [Phycisphaeraceae bacterium]